MYISKVSLVNYRNFPNAKFMFNKGINTIIGENGSGKTNLFRAMRLLLEDSSLQYAYKLNESDFSRALGSNAWRGHWIIISIEFDEISNDEAIQSLFIHGVGITEKEYVTKASYNLFFRPKADIRQKLSEIREGDYDSMKGLLDSLTIKDNYEVYFTGKSNVDFNDPSVYTELVGDFEAVKFPKLIDTSKFGIKIPHQLSVSNEISFTFIQALRDVISDFHNNRTNPLLSLLKNKSGEIKEEDYQPISDLVKDLNCKIETLDDILSIRNDIKSTIQDTVGLTYSPSSLSIKSSLPDEANKLLQSLKLFVGEPNEDYQGSVHELSLGGANLIFLTLKILEFQYQKSKNTFANFLIIEEPEAHIHTHIQKTLFDKLDYGDTQIIYSTHSTHISEVSNVRNINILARRQNFAEVYQPSNGLSEPSIQEIQRYLDAVRTNLLFAKGVILVEGDAEEILIPQMVKKAYGISLDELGISLINIRSTGFENVAQLFDKSRIRRRCSILTDLDDAICDTTTDPGDTESIVKYKKRVVNSKIKGLERKKRIDDFITDNEWLEAFYARYTFEVDFIECGNSWEAIEIIPKVYSDDKTKNLAEKELDSEDVAIFGKRILTMAKQEGKGWFAIMLGEQINYLTVIPEYIIDGIIHAKEDWSEEIIAGIIKFRFREYQNDTRKKKIDLTGLLELTQRYQCHEVTLNQLNEDIRKNFDDEILLTILKRLI